jgi:glycosyltransferase involved in cell wall biosynthesis
MAIRVVHFIAGLAAASGGPSRSVPNQCRSTAADDVEVVLAFQRTPHELAPGVADAIAAGVSVRPLSLLELFTKLPAIIREADVFHLHCIWPWTGFLAAAIARHYRVKLVISPHGTLEPWAIAHKKWKKRVALALGYRRMIHSAVLVHATSQMEAASARRFGLHVPVAIVPNAVDCPKYDRSIAGEASPKTILFLSRLHFQKGTMELARALGKHRSILVDRGWRVVLAGPDSGNHWKELETEFKAQGLRDLVSYVGPVDGPEKWNLFRSATLFTMPSYGENFGIVIAEALACGVPCLTTQRTPWREIEENDCGWWHPATQTGLDEALRVALTTDAQTLSEMGQRGIGLVSSKYTIAALGTDFRSMYRWVMFGGGHPKCFASGRYMDSTS